MLVDVGSIPTSGRGGIDPWVNTQKSHSGRDDIDTYNAIEGVYLYINDNISVRNLTKQVVYIICVIKLTYLRSFQTNF